MVESAHSVLYIIIVQAFCEGLDVILASPTSYN